MSMLQIHAEALDGEIAAYHEFLLRYKPNADVVYGIVEGKEDPMFYRGQIEHNLPEEWEVELIPAGRKDNVLKVLAFFNWERFSRKRICFFVDRDLSDFLQESSMAHLNLYITDNYSIESDVVNYGVLKRLLEEILNINNLNSQEEDTIEQRFLSALAFFQEAMLLIMVQVVLWKRNGMQPCLNNILPKDFFIFTEGKIILKDKFETELSRLQHAAKCVNLPSSDQAELSKLENEFREKEGAKRFIRGKYLLWFLVEFAQEIHRSLPLLFARFPTSPKIRITIGTRNAMPMLAPRVRCPTSLQVFLTNTYGQFIYEKYHSY